MALDTAFQGLCLQSQKLSDATLGLRVTIMDKPLQGDVLLVDSFSDAADDMLGLIEELSIVATDGQQATGHPVDMDRVRRALVTCQERYNELNERFTTQTSYDSIAELRHFGRQRGGEWHAWAGSVKESLDRCREPLSAVNQALFECWKEFAERVGLFSVSVQTTSIGQHITADQKKRSRSTVRSNTA
jgi:hypothetical protein